LAAAGFSERRAIAFRSLSLLALALLGGGEAAHAEERDRERAAIFYLAKVSSASGWEDVMIDPVGAGYIGDYLAVAALSETYGHYRGGRLDIEAEGQIARNFGEERYWQFNVVPVMLRWHQSPWSYGFATSTAFGLGLSYATQLPQIEVELEGKSRQWLVYWVAEVTAGPVDGPWAVSLRLHHRSVAYGLFGDEGGMNALGMGLRWRF
jgi:hypothetical protein